MRGVEAIPVHVEVSVGAGLPGIAIVGLPDSTVQESRLRVKSAIRAVGFDVPAANIVVNLAPSSLKKIGSGFDLPIALGILASTGQIEAKVIAGKTFVGELSLGGQVRGVHGLLAFALMVRNNGGSLVTGQTGDDLSTVLPGRHVVVDDLATLLSNPATVLGCEAGDARAAEADSRVGDARTWISVCEQPEGREGEGDTVLGGISDGSAEQLDYADIAGQDFAKRAMQIAAAGNHSVLMIGPPGSGKTMLARRLPTIMPPLDESQRLETAMIHSVSGLPFQAILNGQRPFRSPHHSATPAGIMGGGMPLTPGEVSLSHNGVLFLDEMPEFSSRVLQMLRQPIEEGIVALARADGTYRFPAEFLLLGAANPCPCGYLGDPEKACSCSPGVVTQYQAKIGGPLIDRFDMMVNVSRSDPKSVMQTGTGTSSEELYRGVIAGREFAEARRAEQEEGESDDAAACDAELQLHAAAIGHEPEGCSHAGRIACIGKDRLLIAQCKMDDEVVSYMEEIARAHTMSGRGIMKVLKVARTIADMEQSEIVTAEHVTEAAMFRMQDRG